MRKILLALTLFWIPFVLALSVGEQAPDFTAKDQDGKEVRLSSFRGKYVLLYFYPKDDTPGCTKEACTFRDRFSEFGKAGAVVFGVSRQDQKSHTEFRKKHRLPFDLLVDSDGAITDAMGIGKIPVLGMTKRQSILIGPDGKVIHIYRDVEPSEHAAQVLADIKAAKGASDSSR